MGIQFIYVIRGISITFFLLTNKIMITKKNNLFSICKLKQTTFFSVWLRNQSISGGFKPVLSHIKKSSIASYYIQCTTTIKTKLVLSGKVSKYDAIKNYYLKKHAISLLLLHFFAESILVKLDERT